MSQQYPKIKTINEYPMAWKEGTQVRITEKVHGQHASFSVVKKDGEWTFVDDNVPLDEAMMRLLNILCDEQNDATVYAELVGVTDLDYGFREPTILVFDIKVNGKFIPWDLVRAHCEMCQVRTVPLLYEGGFTWVMARSMTVGGSTVANPSTFRSTFKGREGIVITPIEETYSALLEGRLIAKSINPDFKPRQNTTYNY